MKRPVKTELTNSKGKEKTSLVFLWGLFAPWGSVVAFQSMACLYLLLSPSR